MRELILAVGSVVVAVAAIITMGFRAAVTKLRAYQLEEDSLG